jgi:hypothetical protein
LPGPRKDAHPAHRADVAVNDAVGPPSLSAIEPPPRRWPWRGSAAAAPGARAGV